MSVVYSPTPTVVPAGRRQFRVAGPVALILFCLFFSALRWLKMESFWGDSPRWIFESWRLAQGEIPYRDFAWQYPPLPLLLFGGALHVFGGTFAVVQIVIDLVSTAVVLAEWRVAKRLLPSWMAFLVAVALACAGAGNTGNFALFSLQLYTPAILVGMLGLLLMLDPLLGFVQTGSIRRPEMLWFAAGSAIALLSKPEFIMGAMGALGAAALLDLKRRCSLGQSVLIGVRSELWVLLVATVPALLAYAGFAWKAGLTNLIAGVTGYGMALLVCPWWPTGLGVFGAVVAVLQAAFVLAVVHFVWGTGKSRDRRVPVHLSIAAVLALPASAIYLPYAAHELPVFAGGVTATKIITFFLSTGTILLPVMWSSIILWLILSVRMLGGKHPKPDAALLWLLASCAVMMSIRTLFSGTLSQLSLVAVAAYPIWFLLAALLIERHLHGPAPYPLRRVSLPAVVIFVGYGVLRFGVALAAERPSHYAAIETGAGSIRLLDQTTSSAIYRYVLEHTSHADAVLDVAYGGVVNFAARRKSPIYSTQFSALAPAERYLDLDLTRIAAHPPALVIASALPDFGATYGMCSETGCMFPELVWRPTRLACEPEKKFPVLEFIKTNYTPAIQFGDKVIYTVRPTLRASS